MTDMVLDMAGESCNGRVVSLLEGGYHRTGLAQCAAAHVEGMAADAK